MTPEDIEARRIENADPEIRKLNDLEADLNNAYAYPPQPLSNAQMGTLLSERRKVIELRSLLSGVMPIQRERDYNA